MNTFTFHIDLYDLALLGTIFIGLAFSLMLIIGRPRAAANRLLGLILLIIISPVIQALGINIHLETYFPRWGLTPLQCALALGPLIYFYVIKITKPEYKFSGKDLLHFSPLLVETCAWLFLEVRESTKTGAATYHTPIFQQLYPIIQLLTFISVCVYLHISHRLIKGFYRDLKFNGGDRYRLTLGWLHNFLRAFALLWLLWASFTIMHYLHYNNPSGLYFCPAYLLLAAFTTWVAAIVILRPEISLPAEAPFLKLPPPVEFKHKGALLKNVLKFNHYYRDPELNLTSLAEKLDLSPHELSRIVNQAFKKSFSDLINEYRVADVLRKMQDPANDHITLLGIAYGSGFNSKTTFNRAFKQVTGINPVDFKNALKKEAPYYNPGRATHFDAAILTHETDTNWSHVKFNRNFMIRNYIKTAWRNLLKNKFYTLINIAGLAVGLAVGILILLWVQDELGFDSFQRQAANIYRLEHYGGSGASKQIYGIDVAPIGPMAKAQMPEVKDQVRIRGNYEYSLYKYQDKTFANENAVYADPSFFSIFDFHLIAGNPAKPFAGDNSVVITRSTAEKFFGNQNPIGKVIRADDKTNFAVSGVIDDFPKNSSINCDMIMPLSFYVQSMLSQHQDVNNDFSYLDYETYLLLKPGSSLPTLTHKLWRLHQQHDPARSSGPYLLLALSKMHLYNADLSDRGMSTVRIFIVIALLTLLIACINYVNLSTARSMLRSKEISMRKIIGAAKAQLFAQFIVETALLFLFAALLALGLVFALMPEFNQLAGKQLVFNLADYHIWLILLATITGTLAASSIYPALLLSSFEPLKALKGKISAGIGDVLFRKILVVTQFTFSIILIIGTIVITRQLNYIRSKNLGYDKTDVLSFWMRDMSPHYDAVKAELLTEPGILGVTRSVSNIVRSFAFFSDADWDGKDVKQSLIFHPIGIDKDFISFFKMNMADGKSFIGAANDSAHFIFNETAIKEMGIKNPVGKRFRMGETTGTIIGVVKDFHYASMREAIAPSVFWYGPKAYNRMYIKTTRRDAPRAIAALEKQFKQYNGEFPFGYEFLDDTFNNIYRGEQREGKLLTNFAAIAIFISCLGLLGLAAYTAQVRTREIGVRKVLGASVSSIVGLLASDFVKLVVLALIIASPVAWYAMNEWLLGFAYRTDINWWLFALAGITALLIAFITISFQSIKTAMMNPVKSLRSE